MQPLAQQATADAEHVIAVWAWPIPLQDAEARVELLRQPDLRCKNDQSRLSPRGWRGARGDLVRWRGAGGSDRPWLPRLPTGDPGASRFKIFRFPLSDCRRSFGFI